MKRLALIIALICVLAMSAGATTYYVKNGGSDGADGLSDGNAWATIAKVNGFTFAVGDTVSFKCGSTWREQLTVPRAGAAGTPMIFNSYSTGAAPIINGADLVGTWSAYTGTGAAPTSSDGFEVGDSDLSNGDGAYWSAGNKTGTGTIVGNATDIVDSGTYSAKCVWATTGDYGSCFHTIADAQDNYVQIRLYVDSTTNVGSAFVQMYPLRNGAYQGLHLNLNYNASGKYTTSLVFNINGSTVTLTGSTVLNMAQWYTIEFRYKNHASAGGAQYWINGTQEGSDLARNTVFTNSDPTTIHVGNAYGANAGVLHIDNVKYGTAYMGIAPANVWKATLTTQPSQVYFDGTRGTLVASADLCNGTGKWYWASNLIYVYSTSTPDTAFTNPGVEASVRTRTVLVSGFDYVTVQNIQCLKSATSEQGSVYVNNGAAVILDGLTLTNNMGFAGVFAEGTGDGKQIKNCTISYTRHDTADRGGGIIIDGAGANHIIENCTIHHNTAAGIKEKMWTITEGLTVHGCTIYQNGAAGISINGTDGTAPSNCIIENNTVYENAQTVADYWGIDLFKCGNNNIVRYNLVHDQHYISVSSGSIRLDGLPSVQFGTGNLVYYNICYNDRCGFQPDGASAWGLYNNVFYNMSEVGIACVDAGVTSGTVKNNIFHTIATNFTQDIGATNIVWDNNCYYPVANRFRWGASTTDFATWKTNCSGDANSKTSDPVFTSTVTPDFSLQVASPCINAGASVGLTADYLGHPIVGLPDMGAYEQQGTGFLATGNLLAGVFLASPSVVDGNLAATGALLVGVLPSSASIVDGNLAVVGGLLVGVLPESISWHSRRVFILFAGIRSTSFLF